MIKVTEAEGMDTSLPQWKAEAESKKRQEYKDALEVRRAAKEAAGIARGKVLHTQARLDVWRTREATRREQMKDHRS